MSQSEGAYCRQVERSVQEGVGKLAGSYETIERYPRRQRARVERLHPPPALEDEHASLIDLLEEADRSASDPSLLLMARIAETTRALRGARDQRLALIDRSEDEDGRYAKAIADIEKSSESLVHGAFDRAEEVVAAMIERLEGSDPPSTLAEDHEALLESSRSYLDAMRAFHDAVRELDPDGAADAVDRCERAKSAVKERLAALCE